MINYVYHAIASLQTDQQAQASRNLHHTSNTYHSLTLIDVIDCNLSPTLHLVHAAFTSPASFVTLYVPVAFMLHSDPSHWSIPTLLPSTTPSEYFDYLNLPSSLTSLVFTNSSVMIMSSVHPFTDYPHPCGLQVLCYPVHCSVSSFRRDTCHICIHYIFIISIVIALIIYEHFLVLYL